LLYGNALLDQRHRVGAGRRVPAGISHDHTADDNPPVSIHAIEHVLLNGPAGVLKVIVHTPGGELVEPRCDVVGLVVDGAIETQFIVDPLAFLVPAQVRLGDSTRIDPACRRLRHYPAEGYDLDHRIRQ